MAVIDYICGSCWSKFKFIKEGKNKHIFCPKCLALTVHPVEDTDEYGALLCQNHHVNSETMQRHGD